MKRTLLALVLWAGMAEAQDVRAVRAAGAVRIDGRLNEAAWAAATPVTALTQREPEEGRPASEATEVRIVFDGDALYVGARMRDRGALTAPLGRRDLQGQTSDWIGVHLDSRHDHQTAAGFWVNPAGVQNDAAGTDGSWDASWNAVWEAATAVDSAGWTAEMRIPFSQLRFAAGDTLTWGVQIERVIGRRNEHAYSTFVPRRERDGAARYGHLTGLGGLRVGRRMEILPYAVARSDRTAPGDNPFRTSSEYGGEMGVDIKYRVTSGLVLDATLNPDFGAVEGDAAEVNLSAFETQLVERRPFFLESADLFDFGAGALGPASINRRLFYTRRIGRRPQLGAPTSRADLPRTASILGAAKLTGRPAPGYSVALLSAVTGEERARYLDEGGAALDAMAEPRTHYFVGRGVRELRGGATRVGAMGTATHRWLDERSAASLRRAAYAGGVDFSHDWAARAWRLQGYLAASRVEGTPAAILATQTGTAHNFQRPDAPHLGVDSTATSLAGWTGQLQLAKQSGAHWRGSAWASATSAGYEVNDLGFHFRGDIRAAGGQLTYLRNEPGRRFRSYRLDHSAVLFMNGALDRVGGVLFLGTDWQLLDYTRLVLNASYTPPLSSDRMTRGGPLARVPAERRVFAEVHTDARRPVRMTAGAYLRDQGEGGWGREAWVRATLQPSPRWNLSVAPFLSRTRAGAQYVARVADATAPGGQRYVFAELDQTTASLETRLSWTFTRALSLKLYAQPFVSAGDFERYKEFAGGFRFDVYGRDRGTIRPAEGRGWRVDPDGAGPAAEFGVGQSLRQSDFNVRSLRGSAVLRWDWRPGSTLHAAWQQSRDDEEAGLGRFRLRHDPAQLFGTRPDNVFEVKLSYWLNP